MMELELADPSGGAEQDEVRDLLTHLIGWSQKSSGEASSQEMELFTATHGKLVKARHNRRFVETGSSDSLTVGTLPEGFHAGLGHAGRDSRRSRHLCYRFPGP